MQITFERKYFETEKTIERSEIEIKVCLTQQSKQKLCMLETKRAWKSYILLLDA